MTFKLMMLALALAAIAAALQLFVVIACVSGWAPDAYSCR